MKKATSEVLIRDMTIGSLGNDLLGLSKAHDKALRRANAERRVAYAANKRCKDGEELLREARSHHAKLRASRNKWKLKAALRARSTYLKVKKATTIVTHKGGRYLARIRQMYYHLFNYNWSTGLKRS